MDEPLLRLALLARVLVPLLFMMAVASGDGGGAGRAVALVVYLGLWGVSDRLARMLGPSVVG